MILTKLQGGLGNQMFQYALTVSLANKYQTDYFFDLSYFANSKNKMRWNLDIKSFKEISVPEINFSHCLPIVIDNGKILEIPDNVFLSGYWQSEKYFIEIENQIRKIYSFDINRIAYISKKYPMIKENALSMHVRRGDYLKYSNIHTVQDIVYYENAYDAINDTNINVMVFSDDIDWCKENLNFPNMYFVEAEDNITDLCAMSMCDHNILSSSSFGWWGAWLNDNGDKKIIAPIRWLGESSTYNDENIVPLSWMRL